MKLRRIGKNISVFLLLGVFFYATSIKELHYAFSAKHQTASHTDHCDHHIHSSNNEEDCFICKMDIVGLFYNEEAHYSFAVVFLPKDIPTKPAEILYSTQIFARSLRGPPYLA
jgi:hypothetical protein